MLDLTSFSSLPAVHPDALRQFGSMFITPQKEIVRPETKIELPIDPYLQQIVELVWANQVVIVVAGTGSGKTTRVPPALLDSGYDVVVTQPRRLACRSVAGRAADERGVALGTVIGYRTALYGEDSPATRLLYCTDGLALVRALVANQKSEKLLVLDEVHEFNSNMEMLLAWIKREIKRNPSQKLVLMSATMDAERLSRFFGNAPIVTVPGNTFEVEVLERGKSIEADAAYWASERGKDTLVFLPGKGEINEVREALEKMGVDAEILDLHADLLPEEQDLVFREYDRRKIILSTNVAQTSLTIPGIGAVIDSGLERQMIFRNGIDHLTLGPISIADELQRKGRTGRTESGIYISHCPSQHNRRLAFPVPEIERSSLDQVVLRFANQGLDIERLQLFHPPGRPAIQEAKASLRTFGCFDSEDQVTNLGRQISGLPVSARIGRMLVEAGARGVLDQMVTAAVLLEGDGIKDRSSDVSYEDVTSDVFSEMELFGQGCSVVAAAGDNLVQRKALLEAAGITPRAFEKTLESRHHLADMCRREFGELSRTGGSRELLASLVSGSLDRLHLHTPSERQPRSFRHYSATDGASTRQLGRESAIELPARDLFFVAGKPFDLDVKSMEGTRTLNLLVMNSVVQFSLLKELAIAELSYTPLPPLTGRPQGAHPTQRLKLYYRDHYIWQGQLSEEQVAGMTVRPAGQ